MRLHHDFSALWAVVERLKAPKQPFQLVRGSNIEQIALELVKGVEIKLTELEQGPSGLLSYQGMQVLLYIPDQGTSITAVLAGNREVGKKFHIAHCEALIEMKRKNRFERYIATSGTSGSFEVQGIDPMHRSEISGVAKLYVCKFCLNKLNYRFSRTNRSASSVRENFDLNEFFETYSSCFEYLPSRTKAGIGDSNYTPDWVEISKKLRADASWRCQECSVTLAEHRHLLHVHHIDGVKNNNRQANLRVLCKACHRRQPLHEGMYVPMDEMKLINKQRRVQGLLSRDWTTVLAHADPALHGLLGIVRQQRKSPPEVEYELRESGAVFDIAWPEQRYGVVIGPALPSLPRGWTVQNLTDALTGIEAALANSPRNTAAT
jgi:hypothetical protein